ncbi:MAG: gamma-glutamyltransferase [Pantoea sp. Brub]|nr:gamma-glutamyltransferase [Pantoea sp. Brub]
MMNNNLIKSGIAVTPHYLATESALEILQEGGNAIEAMVAAAATISVIYPHMNGLGGDGFWLIIPIEGEPIAIDASGKAGSLANLDFYRNEPYIPYRGPKAAITVAGTISGWIQALSIGSFWNKTCIPISLKRLLRDAIKYALNGIPITYSQVIATKTKFLELQNQPGFVETFLPNSYIPSIGSNFIQPKLGNILYQLSEEGLDSFYRGNIACNLAKQMHKLKMPIILEDLQKQYAISYTPIHMHHSKGKIWNTKPPTQGIISLIILGILDQFNMNNISDAQMIHLTVEATKKAFMLRDKFITDPGYINITKKIYRYLNKNKLVDLANQINIKQASAYKNVLYEPSDTVWMGTMDKYGLAVSFIQSIYHEFGSGVVLPETGIIWQNRGTTFSLNPKHILALHPGKKPFHTLNPAGAKLKNNSIIIYGSMGGDGQPQTQAAIFNRYAIQNVSLQDAISSPRWLFGRTWGANSNSLKVENRFNIKTIEQLNNLGHNIELLPAFSEVVGHAGAIVRDSHGVLEGASDPRSNGSTAGF